MCPSDFEKHTQFKDLFEAVSGSNNCEFVSEIALGCRTGAVTDALLARMATESCLPPNFKLSEEAQENLKQDESSCDENFSDEKNHLQATQCRLFSARFARRLNDAMIF